MILKKISILNYKNLVQAELDFSPKINCFVGANGMGKTNLLDAVYYLSFCKSATNPVDSQNIRHGESFFVLQGEYQDETREGSVEKIYCGLKRGTRKQFKRNKKEYERLSDHIGFIPLVIVSPADSELILAGSEERRRFMDVAISQSDHSYLGNLIDYNKALAQRNALLRQEEEPDREVMEVLEEMMASAGSRVNEKRRAFIEEFIPIFQTFYSQISSDGEQVGLTYRSDADNAPLIDTIRASRDRDRIMGFSLKGIHRDDLLMHLGDYPIRREGSQGQNKTYLVALKLAQYDYLHRRGNGTTPLLLLDDIFDKLDSHRVEQIMRLVAGDRFGQVFISDVNREHIDYILQNSAGSYRLFTVSAGELTLTRSHEEE